MEGIVTLIHDKWEIGEKEVAKTLFWTHQEDIPLVIRDIIRSRIEMVENPFQKLIEAVEERKKAASIKFDIALRKAMSIK